MKLELKKSSLNLIIDVLMFINLMAIAGIGFMIKFVLVPGHKRNDIYGRDVDLFFWGIDRHKWGSIHLVLSFILLFLLLLHIILHWNMIVVISKRMIPSGITRIISTIGLVLIIFVLGVLPLFVQPEIQEGNSHHHHQSSLTRKDINVDEKSIEKREQKAGKTERMHRKEVNIANSNTLNTIEEPKHRQGNKSGKAINGSMSLDEVSELTHIPVAELAAYVEIPVQYSGEKLGRLRKKYNFQMNDLREYITIKNQVR